MTPLKFSSFVSKGYVTDKSWMEHALPKRAALIKWSFAEKFIILIECCFSEFGVSRKDKMPHVVWYDSSEDGLDTVWPLQRHQGGGWWHPSGLQERLHLQPGNVNTIPSFLLLVRCLCLLLEIFVYKLLLYRTYHVPVGKLYQTIVGTYLCPKLYRNFRCTADLLPQVRKGIKSSALSSFPIGILKGYSWLM